MNIERRLDEGLGIEKYPDKKQKVTFIKRIINNWKHNVIYGLMYLKACYNDAVGQRYTGDDLLKATYSNYNSNSCSAYIKPSHPAHVYVKEHVKNFWDAYNKKVWNN